MCSLNQILAWLLLLWVWEATAQEEQIPENNIICYAAKSKWVCAPADDEEKAKAKARNLALNSDDDVDESVTITTLNQNNIGAEVRQEPLVDNSIQGVIKDFIPRQKTQDPETRTVTNDTQTVESKPVITNNIPAEDPAATPKSNKDVANDFNQWQQFYGDQWTFQVIGTSNRHQLNQFIEQHGLDQLQYSVVKTQANGADWWVVLAGLYDSREQALDKRYLLPDQLAADAWVRQIKSINGSAD